MMKKLAVLLTALLLSSCAFVPKRIERQVFYDECRLTMPAWELDVLFFEGGNICQDFQDAEACLVTLGVIIPVGSLVVSGSIVLTGNTLRWLEYQGKCDNGSIKNGMTLFRDQMDNNLKHHSSEMPIGAPYQGVTYNSIYPTLSQTTD
jgi:hypothetical protein